MLRFLFKERRSIGRRARELVPGDKVAGRTVMTVTVLNQSSGEPLLLTPPGGKTAHAIRFSFDDGSQIIAHPDEVPPPPDLN